MKNESTSCKKNWLTIIYYFTKKYATDIESSQDKLQQYANELFDEEIEKQLFISPNLSVFSRNNLYLHRYREYAYDLLNVLSEIITEPKKQNVYVQELSTRLNLEKERVEKILLKKTNKRILVTATMSAGKSTLVNALIGNKIMATRNESCTAKRFTVVEDVNAGNQVMYEYKNMRIKVEKNIGDIFHRTDGADIRLHAKMFHSEDPYLWEIIDTPGINSSADPDHKQLTESIIQSNEFDILLYVMNGNHLGTHDDLQHLEFIKENVRCDKIIFVINKVDQFRKSQDSIEESYNKTKNYLKNLGFTKLEIQPISAYAAFLMKKELLKKELNEDEEEELLLFKRKFNREQYDLSQYQDVSNVQSKDNGQDLLEKCGIAALEELIVRKGVKHG